MDRNIVFVLVAAVLGLALFAMRRGDVISSEDARAHVDGGAMLLDVRTEEEFSRGHVEGAINIPVQALKQRLDELGDRGQPIVVYCHSGMRSGNAKRLLESSDFSKVYDLGGMHRW